MLQNTMLKIAQHGGIDVELPLQVKVSLWVKEGSWLRPNCRLHTETMGGTWMSDARDGCRPSPLPLLRPCDDTAALASGQARVGVYEDGRTGKKNRKVNKKERKKRKWTYQFEPPQNNNLHRHHMSCACACARFAATAVVILVYGCQLWVACASGGGEQRRNGRARVCQYRVVSHIHLEERWSLVSPNPPPPRASEGHTGEHEEMAHPAQTGYPVCLCCCVFMLKRRPTHLEWGQQGR